MSAVGSGPERGARIWTPGHDDIVAPTYGGLSLRGDQVAIDPFLDDAANLGSSLGGAAGEFLEAAADIARQAGATPTRRAVLMGIGATLMAGMTYYVVSKAGAVGLLGVPDVTAGSRPAAGTRTGTVAKSTPRPTVTPVKSTPTPSPHHDPVIQDGSLVRITDIPPPGGSRWFTNHDPVVPGSWPGGWDDYIQTQTSYSTDGTVAGKNQCTTWCAFNKQVPPGLGDAHSWPSNIDGRPGWKVHWHPNRTTPVKAGWIAVFSGGLYHYSYRGRDWTWSYGAPDGNGGWLYGHVGMVVAVEDEALGMSHMNWYGKEGVKALSAMSWHGSDDSYSSVLAFIEKL